MLGLSSEVSIFLAFIRLIDDALDECLWPQFAIAGVPPALGHALIKSHSIDFLLKLLLVFFVHLLVNIEDQINVIHVFRGQLL